MAYRMSLICVVWCCVVLSLRHRIAENVYAAVMDVLVAFKKRLEKVIAADQVLQIFGNAHEIAKFHEVLSRRLGVQPFPSLAFSFAAVALMSVFCLMCCDVICDVRCAAVLCCAVPSHWHWRWALGGTY